MQVAFFKTDFKTLLYFNEFSLTQNYFFFLFFEMNREEAYKYFCATYMIIEVLGVTGS